MTHEIPLERRTLHGHFSRDLPPIVTIDSGDTVVFSCLDSGWHVAPGEKFEPRD
jgi:acetamidase/formamidase